MSSRKLALPNYKAEYRLRVLARIYEKSKGKEIVIDTAPPRSTPADQVMEALKRGMEIVPANKNRLGTAAKKKKKVSQTLVLRMDQAPTSRGGCQ